MTSCRQGCLALLFALAPGLTAAASDGLDMDEWEVEGHSV